MSLHREILESKDDFVVRGDLEIDIVTASDLVATLAGTYSIPAVRITGAERPFVGNVPWISGIHELSAGPFDADEAMQRTGAEGPNEVRGCRVLIPWRAVVLTQRHGLSAETLLSGLKIPEPLPIDEGLPSQWMTLALTHCITHPAIRRVGQIIELSKPDNRPDRFGQRLKAALDGFKKTFGESAWREVLDRLGTAYNEPLDRLRQARDDGWDERQRFRDLARIEEASLAYLREVTTDMAAQLVRGQQAAARQAEKMVKKTAQAGVLRQVRSLQ